jgi:nucleoside-diphosphate-sugar epimerase
MFGTEDVMERHVVVGAGPVGSGVALLLAGAGHPVRIVTRGGGGPVHPGIERVAADAGRPGALAAIVDDAAAIYNCANPPYPRWTTDWPPIAAALLDTAERSGAVLVTTSNLYGYGAVDHPISERDPLAATFSKGRVRAQMWEDAIAAHRAGRVRVTEARASDYFGPGLTASSQLGRVIPRILAGKPVRVLGNPDLAHSWTYVPDVSRALATLGTDPRAWGRAWNVPTDAPKTQREMIEAFAEIAGVDRPKVASLPRAVLRGAGLISPTVRVLQEIMYQVERPFVVDSSHFTNTFGIAPTRTLDALRETYAAWAAPVAA